MPRELFWLSWTLGLTLLLWIPYVLNRIAVRGLRATLANPAADAAPLAPWAQRAQAAHTNAIENLAVFGPAALAVHVLDRGDGLTELAAGAYFVARLAHVVVYTAGVPVLRTLTFAAGWAATTTLVARLVGLL